jgi:hypothetical protein
VICEIYLLPSPDFLPAPVNDPVVPVKGKLVAKPTPKKIKKLDSNSLFRSSDCSFPATTKNVKPVLRMRIRMFYGLLDPDPLVRGTDPDPFIIKQK